MTILISITQHFITYLSNLASFKLIRRLPPTLVASCFVPFSRNGIGLCEAIMILTVFMVNKAGSLLYWRNYSNSAKEIVSNERLRLAGMLHG